MDDSSNFVYYTYDSTLKKLLKILKSTTSDNLKQLEDLWDSIDTCTIQPLNTPSAKNINNHMSPTMSSSSHSPLHLSDSSNDSTNSNSNSSSSNMKRDASKMCTSPVNSSSLAKKLKTEANFPNSNSKPKATSKASKESDSVIINIDDSIDSFSKLRNEKTDINNMAVDMLDFSCTICKQFNQELNNKLIECKACNHLYHQLCHHPKIENNQLEKHPSNIVNEEQMVWYLSKCHKCETESDRVDQEVNSINSMESMEQPNKASNIVKNSNVSMGKNEKFHLLSESSLPKKEKISQAYQKDSSNHSCTKSSNSLSSFSNLSNISTIYNITSNGTNGKPINTSAVTNGFKGLAGLATKLNSNSNQQLQLNSISTVISNSLKKTSNPDFLFKKFKETATSNQTLLVTNENEKKIESSSGNSSKKALIASTDSESKNSSNTNVLTKPVTKNSLVTKRNPFNISNSLSTAKSTAGLNNIKDKKAHTNIQSNSSNTAISGTNSNNKIDTISRIGKIS